MKSKSYARIKILSDKILVRFERVGHGSQFNAVLDEFKRLFPLRNWNNSYGAWELPRNNFNLAKYVCEHLIGRVSIEHEYNIGSEFCQLTFSEKQGDVYGNRNLVRK